MPVNCSVIIPTYRRAGVLADTLDALGRQTRLDFEVIVVSDGEDPQARTLAETYRARYPLRWIFNARNLGQASARNTGADAAQSGLLAFLDDDTTPVSGWMEQHISHHQNPGEAGDLVVLGRIVHQCSQLPRSHTEQLMRDMRDRSLAQFEAAAADKRLEFGRIVACGLNISIRRSTFLAAGGFDPRLKYTGEDSDLGARLYGRGVQFRLVPGAAVVHRDTKDLIQYHYNILHCSGRNDLYRRREKHQWNDRIQLLAQMHGSTRRRRLAHRMAWYLPGLFQLASGLCRKATDTTGSRLAFQLWFKLGITEYWSGIRAAGETIGSLADAVDPPAPALMLHSIACPPERNLWSFYLSPGKFSRFLSWLKLAGYSSLLPQEWLARKTLERSVILTFDDAYDDFYTHAFPVLDDHGFKATVFVVVDRIGQTNLWDREKGFPSRSLLSIDQIRDLQRRGVQFGSHSLTHRLLTNLSDKELTREVGDSKRKLEDLLGTEVSCIAYPWGGVDGRVRAAAARAGYKIGMTTQEGFNRCEDPLCLRRTNVCEIDNLLWFLLKLATGRDLRLRAVERLIEWGLHPGWDQTMKAPAEDAAAPRVADVVPRPQASSLDDPAIRRSKF